MGVRDHNIGKHSGPCSADPARAMDFMESVFGRAMHCDCPEDFLCRFCGITAQKTESCTVAVKQKVSISIYIYIYIMYV